MTPIAPMPKVTAMPQIRLIVAAASEGTRDSLVGREPSKAAITSPTYAASVHAIAHPKLIAESLT
ncbi:MAG: hypothetical protein V9E85_03305 [Candidatus Nanopelagicales bacterium]